MKNIIIILLFLPSLIKSQEIKVNKRSINCWDAKLQRVINCNDTLYSVSGTLNTSTNNYDTNFPYLNFSIKKRKSGIDGIILEFNGQSTTQKYVSISDHDSVEIEFEDHKKIMFSTKGGAINCMYPSVSPTDLFGLEGAISINEKDIKTLINNSVFRISFFSAKPTTNTGGNTQAEVLVLPIFKDEIMNCLKILMK